MKRTLIAFFAIVSTLVAVLVISVAIVFAGRKGLQPTGSLSEGVLAIKDGYTSAYCLDAGDGQYVLIDAGKDDKGEAIKAALAAQHIQPEAIRAILLTHGHPDHTAAVPLFPKAEVVALQEEVGVVEGTEGSHAPIGILLGSPKPTGLHVTHPAHDGEVFTVNKLPIRIFATPGHTPGSAAFLTNGALFLGDSADAKKDDTFEGAPWLASDSQSQNIASLKHLAERLAAEPESVKILVFAHSGALKAGLTPLATFAAAH